MSSLGSIMNPLEFTEHLKHVPSYDQHNHIPDCIDNRSKDVQNGIKKHKLKPEGHSRIKKATQTSKRQFLALIVDEISVAANSADKPRHLNRFFNIVLGDNVFLVKEIIEYLKTMRMHKELEWVLGTSDQKYDPNHCSVLTHITHYIMYFMWIILFLVFTPFFYLLQVIIFRSHVATRRAISDDIDLPLVFAVFSEDVDMVKVFLDAGCSIEYQDSNGNNVYHYLADLSMQEPEKAVRCHRAICCCVKNLEILKQLITEQVNVYGLTALESIAKYGSPHFLRYIMVDKSCIGTLRLGVSKHKLWADSESQVFDMDNDRTEDSVSDIRDPDIHQTSLNIWEFEISAYERVNIHGKQSYLLQLVASRSIEGMSRIDVSGLTQSKLLEKWFSIKYSQYSVYSVISHILQVVLTVILLFYIINGGDVDPAPLYGVFVEHEAFELSRAGYAAASVASSVTGASHQSMYNNTCVNWSVSWQDEVITLMAEEGKHIDNCTATALERLKTDCQGIDARYLLSQTLNRTEVMQKRSLLRQGLDYAIVSHIMLDTFIRQGFLLRNYNFQSESLVYGILPVLLRRFPGSYTEKTLTYLMYTCYGAFIYVNNLWYKSIIKRNLVYSEYLRLIKDFPINWQRHDELETGLRTANQLVDNIATITGNILIVCLMLRFLHTIHALRLLPGIGFFVITTKKMAKHLLQFAVVFALVSLAFATIFYFVMRNSDCPAQKEGGFTTLWSSLFSTYQVALGYGEYEFMNNLNAMIAYVAYTIISILLLLNLVIAVMTTTAEELNQLPWKHALCCVESWDEILGTEICVLSLFAPWKSIFKMIRYLCDWQRNHNRVWQDIQQPKKRTVEITYHT